MGVRQSAHRKSYSKEFKLEVAKLKLSTRAGLPACQHHAEKADRPGHQLQTRPKAQRSLGVRSVIRRRRCQRLIGQERYYLSVILDPYDGQVVAHLHQSSMDMLLVTRTLDKWFEKADGLEDSVLHSDQGGHYTARAFRDPLAAKGIVQNMSRKARPLDNAVMESFFGHLKCEAIHCRDIRNARDLAQATGEYRQSYKHERPHSRLDGKAPVEYLNERLSA